MFADRQDAGARLAVALERYRDKDALVLAIPRGGVAVGYEVARHLRAELSIVVARKLPFPDNPEAGFGAVAEDGSTFILPQAGHWLPPPVIERVIEEQRREAERRVRVLRRGRPLPEVAGRTAILVDDGVAMGSTMMAAISLCRNRRAGEVVVAAPVGGPATVEALRRVADDVVVLETPPWFRAVAEAYHHWYDVSDEEVVALLDRWGAEAGSVGADRPTSR